MEAKWFANRGQILQFLVTAIATIIAALNAWPNIKGNDLLTFGPILFATLIVAVGISAVRLSRISGPSASQLPTVKITHPRAKRSTVDGTSKIEFDVPVSVFEVTRSIGEAWQLSTGNAKITVLEIRRCDDGHPDSADYRAVLEIDSPFGGDLVPGRKVQQLTSRRYLVPMDRPPFFADELGFSILFSAKENGVNFATFAIGINHINHQTGVVHFTTIVIQQHVDL